MYMYYVRSIFYYYMQSISYTSLRQNLSSVLDDVENNREIYYITRKQHNDAVVISRDDYESIMETVHLLSSKKNADALMKALKQAKNKEYVKVKL
jgi:antitoxin YefM